MPGTFYFISYSRVDGGEFALRLGDQLTAGPPSIGVWLDRRRLQPGIDWDEQLVEALRGCEGFLYVMTKDSVSPNSECKKEVITHFSQPADAWYKTGTRERIGGVGAWRATAFSFRRG